MVFPNSHITYYFPEFLSSHRKINWIKSILNFPLRFTKPNSRIKNGFYVCRIVRAGSPLPKGSIFMCIYEIFSRITIMTENTLKTKTEFHAREGMKTK